MGLLFSAQPWHQVSLTLLMRTATTAALQIANIHIHKDACKDFKLLVRYHMSVCKATKHSNNVNVLALQLLPYSIY